MELIFFQLWTLWFQESFGLVQRNENEKYVSLHENREGRACLRALAPVNHTRRGQVTGRWAAVQPRYRSAPPPPDRRRESPAQSTPVSCASDAQQTPRTAPRNTAAMGDRVAILLLAVLASALAAEVGLLPVLCKNVALLFFSSPHQIVVVVLRQASLT